MLLVNNELVNLTNWINANKLSLNIKKSKFMLISSPQKKTTDPFVILLNGTALEQTDSIKYLGIYIDKNLAWNEHINAVCNKVSKNIGILCKLRHYVDIDTLRSVYFSLIFPYLQYGALTWGVTYQSRINRIHVLNNKALRIMTFSNSRSHAPPIYRPLRILQFKDIVFTQIALLMYDYYQSSLPPAFHSYFQAISTMHSHGTRQSKSNFYIPSISTNYGKSSLKFNGAKIWNSIDESLKLLPRNSFKKNIKENCFLSYN